MDNLIDFASLFKGMSPVFRFYISKDKVHKTKVYSDLLSLLELDVIKFEHPIYKQLPELIKIDKN